MLLFPSNRKIEQALGIYMLTVKNKDTRTTSLDANGYTLPCVLVISCFLEKNGKNF